MKKWKTLQSQRAFDHHWFKVQRDTVELGNGTVIDDYFYYLHGDVVVILCLTDQNEIVLTKQYRHAMKDFFIELPSGIVDPNEAPKSAAIRELAEETGYTSDDFELLAKLSPSPGKVMGLWYVFLARNAKKGAATHLDPTEDIEVSVVGIPQVLQMIRDGTIFADTTITSVFLACDKLGILKSF